MTNTVYTIEKMTSNAERRLLKDLKKMHEDTTQESI